MWWRSPNFMKEVEVMKKRLTAIFLSFALMLGLTSFAAAEGDIPTAATFDELTALIDNGTTTVELTDTINVAGSLGSDDKTITLTRSNAFFEGPMLQVESGNIKNVIIDGGNIVTEDCAAIINGNCHFEDALFKNCSAGAVSVANGIAMFDDCTFEDNTGESGAHVINNAESVFTGCTFQDGKAGGDGGAIRNNVKLQLQNCTFSENSTGTDSELFLSGGAVYNIGSLYAFQCSFNGNVSMQGGAVYNFGNAELIKCTFTNNSANVGGGINSTGDIRLIDTLLYQNAATESAADLYTTNPANVSYSDDYAFDKTPSGWHRDEKENRSSDKLFEPSFEGSGNLVFLMESDLPESTPPITPIEPTPPPAPSTDPDPEPTITIRPSTNRHNTTVVSKLVKPTLDKANMLYLVGYRDAAPGGNITRRQVAHILYNLMSTESQKYYACETSPFVDVEDDIAIAVLAKAKIVLGYDEHYRPDTYLTMGELCTILSRFSDLKSGASSFQNIEHHWARDYVNICVSSGWLDDSTEIDLNGHVRATDAITIIEKML